MLRCGLEGGNGWCRRSVRPWHDGVCLRASHLLDEPSRRHGRRSRCGARSRGRNMRGARASDARQDRRGSAVSRGMADTWTDLNSFMFTHIGWHLALFYLSQGRDQKCWSSTIASAGESPRTSRRIKSARYRCSRDSRSPASMSGRAGGTWPIISWRARTITVLPFLTLQYLYGWPGRDGRKRYVAGSGAAPRRDRTLVHPRTWRDVGLPAARGCMPTRARLH